MSDWFLRAAHYCAESFRGGKVGAGISCRSREKRFLSREGERGMSFMQRADNRPVSEEHSKPSLLQAMLSNGLSAEEQSSVADLPDRQVFHGLSARESSEVGRDQVAQLKVSILMCAYNEQNTIGQAVREVLAAEYPCDMELIVVDDGSTDATSHVVAQIRDNRIVLHKHSENRGKGAALRTAASLATGTYILPFDADLEYSPKDIPRVIEPILTGRFEVVYGVRLFGYNTVYQSYRYAVGNRVLTTTANVLFDSYLNDLHTCLKLMPLATFRRLRLREDGFGLDTEVTATLLRLGIRPFEVPVSYYSRSHAQGKKINWRDAVSCLYILLRIRTARKRRLFLPLPDGSVRVETESRSESEQAVRIAGAISIGDFDPRDPVTNESSAVVTR